MNWYKVIVPLEGRVTLFLSAEDEVSALNKAHMRILENSVLEWAEELILEVVDGATVEEIG